MSQPCTVDLKKQRQRREQFQVKMCVNSEYGVYNGQTIASETVTSSVQTFSHLKEEAPGTWCIS